MSKQIKDENGKTYVEKKPFYKRVWFWILAVIVIFFVIGMTGGSDEETTSNSSKTESSESKEKENKVEESKEKIFENPTIKEGKELNKEGQTKTLKAGKWTVGKDIKPGYYKITTKNGSGNISSEDAKYDLIITLSDKSDDDFYLTEFTTYLTDKEEIDIEGLHSVDFTAIKNHKEFTGGNLQAGNYIVGLDIKPGRYKITPVRGNGNVSTNDGGFAETMGTDSDDMYLKETTQNLKKGQVFSTDLITTSLTPVK